MSEIFKPILTWLTTSGIKIVGILIGLLILSQMSRWIVKWLERFIPEKDPLQSAEAKKRAQTLGNILRHALLIVITFIAFLMILGELGIQLGPLLATAGIGALAVGFGAQSLVKDVINGFFIDLLSQIGKELEMEEPYKSAILEPLQILGVERFQESEPVIRIMVKTVPLKQWEVGRELRFPSPTRYSFGENPKQINAKFKMENEN